MRSLFACALILSLGSLSACHRNDDNNVEDCGNNIDDDVDQLFDCADPDCAADARCAPVCGDGVAEGGEVCDGNDLNGTACEDLGLPAGNLDCSFDCGSFDTSGCSFFPAPHADMPQIPNNGGPVIGSIKLINLTFQNYAFANTINQFGDFIVQSNWLATVGADYGVGLGTNQNFTIVQNAPTITTDQNVRDLIASLIQNGSLPAPSLPPNGTLYAVYFPSTSVVNFGANFETSCGPNASALGYHFDTVTSGFHFSYAVIFGCPGNGLSEVQAAEEVASHEIIEAASDPFPASTPAFRIQEEPFLSNGGENADMCSGLITTEAGFTLTRSWSNSAAATTNADPCVPEPPGHPYVGVTTDSPAFSVTAGDSFAIPVKAWSSGPAPVWQVFAFPGDGTVDMAPDLNQFMQNGDSANINITVPANAVSQDFQTVQIGSFANNGDITLWAVELVVQ